VANNTTDATGPDLEADSETFQLAFSLIEDITGSPIAHAVPGSNITGVDPQLGALGSNGGLTETHALPATSPAVDKGKRENGTETTDQRGAGFVRPLDSLSVPNSTAPGADGTDIGAFELQSGSSSALRKCAGQQETSASNTGTPGRDVIVGTSRRDVINGKGGNDVICGLGGNDLLLGRGGRDTLRGQGGKDKLKGGAKRDKLFGGPGPDRLIGGAGQDLLSGQAGRDTQIQ
jgi:Ca2+-binding RTX toxin-like protein